MNKRMLGVLTALVLCLLACGCREAVPARNDLDTSLFYANIKADALSPHGKKAAYYDGRVYYLGCENGDQGVYSMAVDGGDVRLAFRAEDIRALWVGAEGFWYCGFSGMEENFNGGYRSFRLYAKTPGEADASDLLQEAARQETDGIDPAWLSECGGWVWDFYKAADGAVYARCISLRWSGEPVLSLWALDGGRLLPCEAFPVEDLQDLRLENGWESRLALCARGSVLLQSENLNGAPGQPFFAEQPFSLFDADPSVQAPVMGPDRVWNDALSSGRNPFASWICRVDGEQVLLAAQRGVVLYDRAAQKARALTVFSGREQLYQVYDRGSDVLLLTERLLPPLLRRITGLRVSSETLYRLDPATGERTRLMRLGYGGAFLYVDGTRAVSAAGTRVRIYDITGEKAVLTDTLTLQHAVVRDENKLDAAGGWLFLYGYCEETGRDELLEKIYIG